MKKGKALAVVECKGLPTAIAFLDTALKSANVELLGMELAGGEGMVNVKITGDVGAVKAAAEAGSVIASKVGGILAKTIIPRPHDNLGCMLKNDYVIRPIGEASQAKEVATKEYTCNLCQDVNCRRLKGQSHTECIHYDETVGKRDE